MTRKLVRIITVASLLGGACNQGRGPATDAKTSPDTSTVAQSPLTPVVLPDLSPLAESVRAQLRDRQTKLTQTLAKEGASPSERADAYADLGRVLMAAKFADTAASCFAHAEALAPNDARWPYYLGHAYLRTGDRDRAAVAFERVLTLRPADLAALVWLGETYFDAGKLDLAQAAFRRAIALDPQSAAALFGAGRTSLAQQAYGDAVQLMERALAFDGKASAIHYPLGMAYRALGNQPQAEAHLRQRGSAFPDLADPLMQENDAILDSALTHEGRGMDALKRADFGAAAASFRKGLELSPGDAALRYWLGAALYASGDTVGAEREFVAVIRRSPGFAKAYFSLGAIADSRGHRAEAIGHYRSAVRTDPGLPEARLRLAEDLRAAGQADAAFTQYEAAVTLDPGIAEAWIGGAQALTTLGRTDKAIEWITQARRIHPTRPEFAELQKRLAPAGR